MLTNWHISNAELISPIEYNWVLYSFQVSRGQVTRIPLQHLVFTAVIFCCAHEVPHSRIIFLLMPGSFLYFLIALLIEQILMLVHPQKNVLCILKCSFSVFHQGFKVNPGHCLETKRRKQHQNTHLTLPNLMVERIFGILSPKLGDVHHHRC